MHNNNVEN